MTDWYSKIQKMGDGLVADALPSVKVNMLKLPTPSLNWALGGGLAFGKILTVYGPESSGKSLIALLAAAEIHKNDPEAWVKWYDAEYSFDKDYAAKLGVDVKRMWITQSNKPSDIFDHFTDVVYPMIQGAKDGNKMPIKLFVVDSLKAIRGPRESATDSVEDHVMGDSSQLLNKAFRKILEPIRKESILTILVQQVNEEMDQTRVMQGHKHRVPGGNALKHMSDYMVLVEKVNNKASKIFDETHKNISDVPIQLGHIIRCKVEKNRTDSPNLVAQFRLRYGVGIVDVPLEIAELAVNIGAIQKISNSVYAIGDTKVNGFANLVKKIGETPELYREILAAIEKVDLFSLGNATKGKTEGETSE